MSRAQSGHRLGISVQQVAETQRNGIKFGQRSQNPDVRMLRQQRNKPRLVGDKVEEGLIEDQADVQRPAALRNGFQQAPLRQQAGGVVRGTEKQAVQRRSQGIEDRVGQLPAIALPQGIYSTTSQSTVCSARRYSAKPGMTIIARRGLRPWTRVKIDSVSPLPARICAAGS